MAGIDLYKEYSQRRRLGEDQRQDEAMPRQTMEARETADRALMAAQPVPMAKENYMESIAPAVAGSMLAEGGKETAAKAATGMGLSAGAQSALITGGLGVLMQMQKNKQQAFQRKLDDFHKRRQAKMSALERGQAQQDRALQAIESVYAQSLL